MKWYHPTIDPAGSGGRIADSKAKGCRCESLCAFDYYRFLLLTKICISCVGVKRMKMKENKTVEHILLTKTIKLKR